MSDIRSQKQLEELRKRLYARSNRPDTIEREPLSEKPVSEVPTSWQAPVPPSTSKTDSSAAVETGTETTSEVSASRPRRRYRLVILLVSLILFVGLAGTASLYLYFGANQISSGNVALAINAPTAIGGGEVLPMQVAVSNQNTVPIESVTLIMTYPSGTQSTDETPRPLLEERIPLDVLNPGESRNVPVRAVFFGNENEEQLVKAMIEYRIENSNGTFYKEAEPLSFRLLSSPLLLATDAPVNVSAGQEVTVDVTLRSNAANDLQNILIVADYPNDFVPIAAEPEPVSGENIWRIETLPAQETITISVRGLVDGLTNESLSLLFTAGPAESEDAITTTTDLAEARQEFQIENPFIRVVSDIEYRNSNSVILPPNENATMRIDITNTLPEPVFDMVVEVVPRGNVIGPDSIQSSSGFYDSNTNTVRWEVRDNLAFEEVNSGETRRLSFTVNPLNDVKAAASFAYDVNVYARRLVDNQSIEQLVGAGSGDVKYHSTIAAGRQVAHNTTFTGRGPIPPRVGETTTYTITLAAFAGANNVENARASTRLTGVVDWEGQIDGDGELVFNSVTNELEWVIGDIAANETAQVSFQVSVTPSRSQIGDSIQLLNNMSVRANDQFTGTLLRASTFNLSNTLSTEAGYAERNGVVQP